MKNSNYNVNLWQTLLEPVLGHPCDVGTVVETNFLQLGAALSQLVQRSVGDVFAVAKMNPCELWAVLGQVFDGLVGDLVTAIKINLG